MSATTWVQTQRWRASVLWGLYSPVRALLGGYVLAIIVGAILEGLALAAVVPLFGETGGAVSSFYERLLGVFGLDASDQTLVLAVGFLFVLRAFARYLSTLLAGLMVRREAVRLQVDLFRAYLEVDWNVALAISQGEVNLLLSTQTGQVAEFLRRVVLLMESTVYAVGLTAVAVVVSPEYTAVALALVGGTGIGVTVIGTRVSRYAKRILLRSKAQASVLLQYARGAQMLRAYAVTDQAVDEVEGIARDREGMMYRLQRAEAFGQVVPDLLFVIALLGVVSFSLGSGGGIAEVGAIVALLYRVAGYLKRFGEFSAIHQYVPALRDVRAHQELFRENVAQDRSLHIDPDLPPGSLRMEDIRLTYPSSHLSAVDGVTQTVAPGEFIGIVGSSGSGKSSLLLLMVGLLEPSSGSVVLGVSDERAGVAFVPQSPFILKGTLASNVRWFRDIDDAKVESACEQAGLADVLARLPDGIDTTVEQEGLTLSGGERQRLALARALAGAPEILILDEATSALDSESERAIQSVLEDMHGAVTVVAVAHRLSTVLSADRVWVMESGRLVEDASPQSLLRDRESRFAHLSSLQRITDA